MDKIALEKRLDYGEQWGFIMDTHNPNLLGWILINKYKPEPITPVDPQEDPEGYQRWLTNSKALRATPYHIHVAEIDREAHESGSYLDNEDYHRRENYYVATLDEVEEIISRLGFSFDTIQHRSQLDAP